MKSATIRTMQALALAAVMVSATHAAFAQRKQQPTPAPAQTAAPAVQTQAAPAAQTQALPAAQNSVCGNQALCYETTDFAATITQFRTSVDAWGNKVLDTMMHFQNKTNQVLSLGYVEGSASGLDDRGNRFGMNTANGGVRGIGVVAGNNMDPKFSLQPGGTGDARFELYWSPRGQIAGVSYEEEFSIREINRVEGNQWMLGNETLLHYDGLSNGVGVAGASGSVGMGSGLSGGAGTVPSGVVNAPSGAANATGGTGTVSSGVATVNSVSSAISGQPTTAAAGQPCPPGTAARVTNVANAAGQQNAAANNAVTNATTAISSLGSLFHKKAATPAAANATPCVAIANGAATPSPAANPVANPLAQQPATAASSGAPTGMTGMAKGVAMQPTTAATTKASATQTKPSPAIARTPVVQPVPATAVTKASLKQPATPATTPAAKKPAVVPATKKPATPATAVSGGPGGTT